MSFDPQGLTTTRTGGRPASSGVITGRNALSVGMPANWPDTEGFKWTLLSSVARLESGHTPSRKHPEYWGGDVPWIGIKDATGNHGGTLYSTQQYTNALGIANSSARVLPKNTVCLSRTASVGYVVAMGCPMATSQDFVNWVCSEQLDHRYLKYILLSEHESMLRFASGTTHQTIYFPEAKAFHVLLPQIEQQRKIADILQSLDDHITLLRETNATLEAIAQALFKSWFVDFDPVRAKAEGRQPEGMDATTAALFPDSFEESEQGLVPKSWTMCTLGAVCKSNGGVIQTGPFGSQLHASDYVQDGVPVVMPKDISNRRVDASSAAKVRIEDALRLSRHELCDGDIVFSRRGDVEKHALIGELENGWLCGTGCLLVRPGSRRNLSSYLSRSLDLSHIKQWLTQHAVGATMPNLNTGILSAVPVVLPNDEVLSAFDQATNSLDERISRGNGMAQTLTQLRDTLLPRLISGQLRLPEAEAHL
ncbi:restriction endonuclease subunit S [Pseudomonas sp. NPDC078700]|uniref:restriction endonuclease subunit S n=1 Tax=Pseudomonas sp. NPDC078700 TaxID=3364424 RepID=UPI0037C627BA